MNQKNKGCNAERELIHLLWKHKFPCIRVAGSGSSRYPSPDIVAGNALRKIAFECKAIGDTYKHLSKHDIEQLVEFSKMFGAEAWLAVRFDKNDWLFLNPEDLNETDKGYSFNIDIARNKGLLLEELIG